MLFYFILFYKRHDDPCNPGTKKLLTRKRVTKILICRLWAVGHKVTVVKPVRVNFVIRDCDNIEKMYRLLQAWYLRSSLEQNTETMANNTALNVTNIMPTYFIWYNRNSDVTTRRILAIVIKRPSHKSCESDFSHTWQLRYWTCAIRDKCGQVA